MPLARATTDRRRRSHPATCLLQYAGVASDGLGAGSAAHTDLHQPDLPPGGLQGAGLFVKPPCIRSGSETGIDVSRPLRSPAHAPSDPQLLRPQVRSRMATKASRVVWRSGPTGSTTPSRAHPAAAASRRRRCSPRRCHQRPQPSSQPEAAQLPAQQTAPPLLPAAAAPASHAACSRPMLRLTPERPLQGRR